MRSFDGSGGASNGFGIVPLVLVEGSAPCQHQSYSAYGTAFLSRCGRGGPWDKQLAKFLRNSRGQRTYVDFAQQLGIPASTLHRLESGEQSATLGKVDQITRSIEATNARRRVVGSLIAVSGSVLHALQARRPTQR